MAMPMQSLEIDGARVSSISIDMVNLKLVSMVEEQSTVGAASALAFAQGGQTRIDRRVLPSSFTPIHPIPIVRTPIACDFSVSQTGGIRKGGEVCMTRTGSGRGKHLAGLQVVPVAARQPSWRVVAV